MDMEHWARALLGAGATLLAALLTVLARAILKSIVKPPKRPPGSETTDVLTVKIVRHSETRSPPAEDGPRDREEASPREDEPHGRAGGDRAR